MPNPKDVYKALKEAGVDVYWKPQAPVDLNDPCCLVSGGGDITEYGTDVLSQEYINVDVCVPTTHSGLLSEKAKEAKDVLKSVPGLRYNGSSSDWVDDNMRASITTLEYRVSKRNR